MLFKAIRCVLFLICWFDYRPSSDVVNTILLGVGDFLRDFWFPQSISRQTSKQVQNKQVHFGFSKNKKEQIYNKKNNASLRKRLMRY